MKIMWIVPSFNTEDEETNTVSGPLKRALTDTFPEDAELTVVYSAAPGNSEKFVRGNTTYFPVDSPLGSIGVSGEEWEGIKTNLLRAIEETRPDVIQCFGTEPPYGAIAEYTAVPVVIHMMGFLNIYHASLHLVTGLKAGSGKSASGMLARAVRRCRRTLFPPKTAPVSREKTANAFELRTMRANRFFMGRTEWDRNIVKYYSPGALYFHVPEAIKQAAFRAAGTWRYKNREKLRLLTVSSGDDRKGNEIILRCAALLRDVVGLDFEWRVTGQGEYFPKYEAYTGIRREDVHVELIGLIDTRQVVKELQEADLFIHPSIIDNSPNAVCEAQLVGCPVVASNVGGVPQLVEDGVTGFLYPYSEPHTLAFLIGNIYHEEQLLKRVSAQETAESVRRHDPRRVAEAVMEVYRTVTGGIGDAGKKPE